MEFVVGDYVFIKVSLIRGVIQFGIGGKLAPRFIGPFKILKRIGSLAYKVELSTRWSGVHDVFHVSHLRKYVHDPTLIIPPSQQEMWKLSLT